MTSGNSIIVAGDLHVTGQCDTIDALLREPNNGFHKHNPHSSYFNANTQLEIAVERANDDPKVVAVVFNGDLVDYLYPDYIFLDAQKGSQRETNWKRFEELISGLKVPHHSIPGNHDFHEEPYNARWHHPLRMHLQLPDGELKRNIAEWIIKSSGWSAFRGVRKELASFFSRRHAIDAYEQFEPRKLPRSETIALYDCLFLNTRYETFAEPGYRMTLWKVIKDKGAVNLLGLDRENQEYAQAFLEQESSNPAYIFTHAPLINDRNSSRKGLEYELSLQDFSKSRERAGLDKSVFVEGSGEMFSSLMRSKRNITLIGSHTHKAKYFLIDKATGRAKESDITLLNALKDDQRYIKLATTHPLGTLSYESFPRNGYLMITPEGLRSVELNILTPGNYAIKRAVQSALPPSP